MQNLSSALKQISKHNQKINRVLSKLTDNHPEISQQIQLALYSSVKINKVIHKIDQQTQLALQPLKNNQLSFSLENPDEIYQMAKTTIQDFKQATNKLSKKVGILLHEEQSRQAKAQMRNSKRFKKGSSNTYKTVNYYDDGEDKPHKNFTRSKRKKYTNSTNSKENDYESYENSPYLMNYERVRPPRQQSGGRLSSSRKKYQKQERQYEPSRFNEQGTSQSQDQESKNMSQLDFEIMQLAHAIKEQINFEEEEE